MTFIQWLLIALIPGGIAFLMQASYRAGRKGIMEPGYPESLYPEEPETPYDRMRQVQAIEAQMFVGKPAIFVPNEWQDPLVGYVVSVDTEKGIMTKMFDYVTNETRYFIGKPMYYTEQRITALMKLDPYERCCLLYQNCCNGETFDKPKSGVAHDKQYIIRQLRQNGFFEQLQADADSRIME